MLVTQTSEASTAAAPDSSASRSGRHANTTLVVLFLSLGGLAFAVLQSLVAPALPEIAKDLNASTSDISWVLTAYLLSASVLTPIVGVVEKHLATFQAFPVRQVGLSAQMGKTIEHIQEQLLKLRKQD